MPCTKWKCANCSRTEFLFSHNMNMQTGETVRVKREAQCCFPTEKAADHDTGFYNCSVTQSRLFFCVCHTTYCGGSSHHRRSLTQPDLKSTHSAAATTKKEKKKCRLLSPSRLCEHCDCLTNVLRLPRRPQTSVDGEAIKAFWRDGVFRNTKSQMLHQLQRGLHQMLPPRDEKEALWVIKACISSSFFSEDVFSGTFM